MLQVVAEAGAVVVLMHMRGTPRTMQLETGYGDVVEEVRSALLGRVEQALAAGVRRDRIVIDPGIGFGKDVSGNLALLRALGRISDTGLPVLVGTSRKSFLGRLTGAPPLERLGATLASILPAFDLGRAIVRVHDVEQVVGFRVVWEALYGS
jgi:dihydropteroate synthase